ncbi:hypothetical protein JVX92_11545 [Microbacterium hominis]|uniref:hypothetical protein n=1 Tax=Microbacterium hominis TaxID=162426 RepID=UPI001965D103|nr:hypothetical protein [Microbacterium hominis]QRY40129.1 hypothetical protein JVX92_11545 [Microbacterium hominis]
MVGSDDHNAPVRFTALLAGASVGLVLGACYLGWLQSFGNPWTGVVNALRAIFAGGMSLAVIGYSVTLPVLSLARRWLSEKRSLTAALGATIGALLLAAFVIAIGSGSGWVQPTLLIIMGAGIVCIIPALGLARFFTARRRAAVIVVTVASLLGLLGGLSVLMV